MFLLWIFILSKQEKNHSNMKKKLLFVLILIFLLSMVLLWKFVVSPADLKGQGELSLRAQEFIANQRQTGKSLWNTVSMETPTTQVLGSQSFATSCFTVAFPWNVVEQSREDQDGKCTFRGRVAGKPITLSVHSEKYDQPLSEYTGVKIRLLDKKTYTQESVSVSGQDNSLYFKDEDSSVLISKAGNQLRTVALSGGMEQERRSSVLVSILEKMEFQ